MGNCQNYGPFLGPYYNTGPNLGDPKRDHNFDSSPCGLCTCGCSSQTSDLAHAVAGPLYSEQMGPDYDAHYPLWSLLLRGG